MSISDDAFYAIFTIISIIVITTVAYAIMRSLERVMYMATKSILKNVDIKDKKLGKSLVIALEHAAGKQAKDVELSRTYEDVRGERLRSILQK